jgi:hypothetical protein
MISNKGIVSIKIEGNDRSPFRRKNKSLSPTYFKNNLTFKRIMVKSQKKKTKSKEHDYKISNFFPQESLSPKKNVDSIEKINKKERVAGIDQLKKLLTNRARNLNIFNLLESPEKKRKRKKSK